GQPKKKSDYLLFGSPSKDIYDVSPRTIAAARALMPGMTPAGALHGQMAGAGGMIPAGQMHQTDLSGLRELTKLGAPPVVKDVYTEIQANGDRDSHRNVVNDMVQLGHSSGEASQAIRDLEGAKFITKDGTKEQGSPVYIIVR
ncbi:hypothetical protein LCGC14_3148310, partial [marine sediment metagenome]